MINIILLLPNSEIIAWLFYCTKIFTVYSAASDNYPAWKVLSNKCKVLLLALKSIKCPNYSQKQQRTIMCKCTFVVHTCQFLRRMSKGYLPDNVYLSYSNGLKQNPNPTQSTLTAGLACRSWRMKKPQTFCFWLELESILMGNQKDLFWRWWAHVAYTAAESGYLR